METPKPTPEEMENSIIANLDNLTPDELNRVHYLVHTLTIMQGVPEKDKADATFFRDAMKADLDAGTLTPGKLRGYIAAIQESLCPPGTTLDPVKCALSEIKQDFRTLGTLVSRLLNDDLPEYRDRLEEISSSLVMNLDAVTDVYNILSEQIEDKIKEGLDY